MKLITILKSTRCKNPTKPALIPWQEFMNGLLLAGFGNMYPSTFWGRLFCIVFVVIGVPLMFTSLAQIGKGMHKLNRRLANRWYRKDEFCSSQMHHFAETITIGFIGTFTFIIIPSIIIYQLEGWDFGDSVYFVVITLSTVGFGDYVAGMCNLLQFLHIFHIIIEGICWHFIESWRSPQNRKSVRNSSFTQISWNLVHL